MAVGERKRIKIKLIMYSQKTIWIGMIVGSTLGGLAPLLWGGSEFSFSGVILSSVGAMLGIWWGVKVAQ